EPPGVDFSGVELSAVLFNRDCKRDALAICQVDTEPITVTGLQIARTHVEDPDAIAVTEGRIWNIVVLVFIRVRDLTTHSAQHRQRSSSSRKHRIRIGDRVAASVAHGELHRNSAAGMREYTSTVAVDWLQNNAAVIWPTAGIIPDCECSRRVTNVV